MPAGGRVGISALPDQRRDEIGLAGARRAD